MVAPIATFPMMPVIPMMVMIVGLRWSGDGGGAESHRCNNESFEYLHGMYLALDCWTENDAALFKILIRIQRSHCASENAAVAAAKRCATKSFPNA